MIDHFFHLHYECRSCGTGLISRAWFPSHLYALNLRFAALLADLYQHCKYAKKNTNKNEIYKYFYGIFFFFFDKLTATSWFAISPSQSSLGFDKLDDGLLRSGTGVWHLLELRC